METGTWKIIRNLLNRHVTCYPRSLSTPHRTQLEQCFWFCCMTKSRQQRFFFWGLKAQVASNRFVVYCSAWDIASKHSKWYCFYLILRHTKNLTWFSARFILWTCFNSVHGGALKLNTSSTALRTSHVKVKFDFRTRLTAKCGLSTVTLNGKTSDHNSITWTSY